MNAFDVQDDLGPSERIDARIAELADWPGRVFAHLRRLVLEADPDIAEEWKWGTAVWTRNGLVCSAAAMKDHVKLNFKGAALKDPHGVFNSGLDAKATRAIDIRERDAFDEPALKELIRAAVAFNAAGKKK